MSLSDDFPNETAQSVTIATATAGEYGPEYGEGTAYDCYVKQKVTNIRDKNGVETVSHCQFYLDGSVTVNDDDRLTYDGATPPILKIDKRFDENGNDYAVIVFT